MHMLGHSFVIVCVPQAHHGWVAVDAWDVGGVWVVRSHTSPLGPCRQVQSASWDQDHSSCRGLVVVWAGVAVMGTQGVGWDTVHV